MNQPAETNQTTHLCPKCGSAVSCGMTQGCSDCWCMKFPNIMPLESADTKCLCPQCLEAAIRQRQQQCQQ